MNRDTYANFLRDVPGTVPTTSDHCLVESTQFI